MFICLNKYEKNKQKKGSLNAHYFVILTSWLYEES